MVKVKEQVHVPQVNEFSVRCRQCDQQIDIKAVDLDHNEIKVFHATCYTKFLEEYKEYGMRIGARIHGKRSKKRLTPADRTMSGDDTFE